MDRHPSSTMIGASSDYAEIAAERLGSTLPLA
jgi:hypothetical protein